MKAKILSGLLVLSFISPGIFADNGKANGNINVIDDAINLFHDNLTPSPTPQNAPPGLARKGQMPPGLAKKNKVPPGWNKHDKQFGQHGAHSSTAPTVGNLVDDLLSK